MGWASGSRLLNNVIDVVATNVDDADERVAIYLGLIEAFEDFDCDTIDECLGNDDSFDEAYEEYYGIEPEEEFLDEEEEDE